MWRFALVVLWVGLAADALAAPAAQGCSGGHGLPDRALESNPFEELHQRSAADPLGPATVVTRIRFVRQNVFPQAGHWLARQANRFNVLTTRGALAAAIPFAEGEVVTEQVLAETERILRAKPFLYDAVVLVAGRCPDGVRVDVVTREVWTLTPGLGFNRSGGDNETNLSLTDVNVLGSGKSLSLEYFSDRDRSGTFLSFDDPNVRNSRWTAQLIAADNDDGNRYSAALTRPFYSLDSRWAGGAEFSVFSRERDLEFLGRDAFNLDVESDAGNLFVARSSGRQGGWIHRQFLGFRYLEEDILFPADFPDATRIQRRFAYPYLAWQSVQERFEERRDLRRVGITEDVQLGWSGDIELGWSSGLTGGRGDYLLTRGGAAYRRFLRDRHLFSISGRLSGRYDLDAGQTEDLIVDVDASILFQQAPRWRFETALRYVHTENLQPDKQLTLGGDSDLRGYPSRYQPGDRRILLTLEQRYYSDLRLFGLLQVGYAAFVDVGRAWFHNSAPSWVPPRDGDHFGTLADAGLGLRLESIRTRRDRVFHIDIARPLVDGPEVGGWQLILSGKQRF